MVPFFVKVNINEGSQAIVLFSSKVLLTIWTILEASSNGDVFLPKVKSMTGSDYSILKFMSCVSIILPKKFESTVRRFMGLHDVNS